MPKIPHPEGEAIGGNTMTTLTAVYPATTDDDDETTLFAAADSEPRSQQIAAAEPAPLPGDVPFENAAEWLSIL